MMIDLFATDEVPFCFPSQLGTQQRLPRSVAVASAYCYLAKVNAGRTGTFVDFWALESE
jgi:hypothetical protein